MKIADSFPKTILDEFVSFFFWMRAFKILTSLSLAFERAFQLSGVQWRVLVVLTQVGLLLDFGILIRCLCFLFFFSSF